MDRRYTKVKSLQYYPFLHWGKLAEFPSHFGKGSGEGMIAQPVTP